MSFTQKLTDQLHLLSLTPDNSHKYVPRLLLLTKSYRHFQDHRMTKQEFSYLTTIWPYISIRSHMIDSLLDITPEDLYDDICNLHTSYFYYTNDNDYSARMVEINFFKFANFHPSVTLGGNYTRELLQKLYKEPYKRYGPKKQKPTVDISQTCML